MNSAKTGDVVLYSYLWAREHERGEESGRKQPRSRPPIPAAPPEKTAVLLMSRLGMG